MLAVVAVAVDYGDGDDVCAEDNDENNIATWQRS